MRETSRKAHRMRTTGVPVAPSLSVTTAVSRSCGRQAIASVATNAINIPAELRRIDAYVERLKQEID